MCAHSRMAADGPQAHREATKLLGNVDGAGRVPATHGGRVGGSFVVVVRPLQRRTPSRTLLLRQSTPSAEHCICRKTLGVPTHMGTQPRDALQQIPEAVHSLQPFHCISSSARAAERRGAGEGDDKVGACPANLGCPAIIVLELHPSHGGAGLQRAQPGRLSACWPT